MKYNQKASLSLKKVAIVSVFLILLFSLGIKVLGAQIRNVKIVFSNNYEMDIVTTKKKVSEILEENHIVILPEETVIPGLDEEISNNKKIIITKNANQIEEIMTLAEETEDISIEQVMQQYASITEKIVTEQVVIPFETITKETSSSATEARNKVIQNGVDGLKEVTYKIKYQNDIEIDRMVIKETIIQEPVNKIVQVQKVSSRGTKTTRTTTTANTTTVGTYKVTAYCSCAKCCGKTNGITSSGKKATAGHTVAAPAKFAIGTKLSINGKVYTVEDRGGAITGNKIDIYMNSHAEALAWGVKYLKVEVVK